MFYYNLKVMGRTANDGRGRIGGRAKGTKNKPQEPVTAWVSGLINRRRAQFERDLDALTPEQRADIMGRLIAANCLPQQAAGPQPLPVQDEPTE